MGERNTVIVTIKKVALLCDNTRRNEKVKKKMLAWILAVAITVTFTPMIAFGANGAPQKESAGTQSVETNEENGTEGDEVISDENGETDKKEDMNLDQNEESETNPSIQIDGTEEIQKETMNANSIVATTASTVIYTWPTKLHQIVSHGWWGYDPGEHYHDYHYGIDIPASYGSGIYAAADGTVILSTDRGDGYGKTVLIKHANGQVTRYSHCSSLKVTKGQKVKRGAIIANVGNTGGNYGYHLHFGIYKSESAIGNEDGRPASEITINPEKVLVVNTNSVWASTLTASNNPTSGKVVLFWGKYNGASKYYVYAKKTKAKKYTRVKKTTATTYTHTKGKATWGYKYYVKAVKKNGKTLKKTYAVHCVCDLAMPVYKSISNDPATGTIKLTWNEVFNANCYRLYRATSKDGTYKLVRTTKTLKVNQKKPITAWSTVGEVPGTTYYYKIQATHTKYSGGNSALSKYMYQTCDLPRPVVTATQNEKSVVVTWKSISGASEYDVYKATNKNSNYSKLITTSKTSVENVSNLASGNTYYYKVCAKMNNAYATSAFSTVISVKYK